MILSPTPSTELISAACLAKQRVSEGENEYLRCKEEGWDSRGCSGHKGLAGEGVGFEADTK